MSHITQELKHVITHDLIECENAIVDGTIIGNYNLHNHLVSKYSTIIEGFADKLKSTDYDDYGFTAKANIQTMRQRLLLFIETDLQDAYNPRSSWNHRINRNKVSNEVLFGKAIQRIEKMSSLNSKDSADILEKIGQLWEITESGDDKAAKWKNANHIIKWVADTDYDVGIVFVSLLFRIR